MKDACATDLVVMSQGLGEMRMYFQKMASCPILYTFNRIRGGAQSGMRCWIDVAGCVECEQSLEESFTERVGRSSSRHIVSLSESCLSWSRVRVNEMGDEGI